MEDYELIIRVIENEPKELQLTYACVWELVLRRREHWRKPIKVTEMDQYLFIFHLKK